MTIPTTTRSGNLVAAGFALTALSYGLGRFAYGLLLPEIRQDLALSATAAGWIGGSAFAAYCVGIIFALTGGEWLGERWVAFLAGATTTTGLVLVAVASSSLGLDIAIILAGLSTGLTSPPLAAAVARCIPPQGRQTANGAMNAGTAAGIIGSGLAAMLFAAEWRALYVAFALVGLLVTLWLWFALPARRKIAVSDSQPTHSLKLRSLGGLCMSTVLMGAASTAIWTFGAAIMRDALGMGSTQVAMAWTVLGTGGLAGIGTGVLTSRYGTGLVHRGALFAMAVAITFVAMSSRAPVGAFPAMAIFGASYIVSTGAFLMWGLSLFPDRPGFGLGLPFLAVAIGQTAGAPLFGTILDRWGSPAALGCSAVLMGSAALWSETGTATEPATASGALSRPDALRK